MKSNTEEKIIIDKQKRTYVDKMKKIAIERKKEEENIGYFDKET